MRTLLAALALTGCGIVAPEREWDSPLLTAPVDSIADTTTYPDIKPPGHP